MARRSHFTPQVFIDAAITLVVEGGPAAATLTEIARKAGAPTGSIYHRFKSHAAILATAWAAAHADFARCMRAALGEGNGLMAALMIPYWARQDLTRARFLLLNQPGALFGDAAPDALRSQIERQEQDLETAFGAYVQGAGHDGAVNAETTARARFLVFDGPIALVSPHLAAGGPIPQFVDAAIRDMHAGIAVNGRA